MSGPLLETRGIAVRFGGVEAIKSVSLAVSPHECLAVIGDNGAGKSTLLNVLTGYVRPNAGHVFFGGREITGLPPRAVTRAGIARSFQHPEVFTLYTVLDNLRFAVAAHAAFWRPRLSLRAEAFDAEARALTEMCGLGKVAGARVRRIAEGERKLLDVAMALALHPRLLLMDEPTSGVSSHEKFAVMDTLIHALRAQRITAVFVEHDMEVVGRYADRVAVMEEGAVIALGGASEVLGRRAGPPPAPATGPC